MSRANSILTRRSVVAIMVGRAQRWYRFHSLAILIGIVNLGISAVSAPSNSAFFFFVGVVSSAIGVFELAALAILDLRRLDDIHNEIRSPPLNAPYESAYSSWRKIEFDGRSAINDPELDRSLQSDREIPLVVLTRTWRVARRYEPIRRLLAVKLDFDESKIRLASDLLSGSDSVLVQKTPYSAFRVTNLLGEIALVDRGIPEMGDVHDAELMSQETVILRNGLIPTLARSGCSNHVGVDVLAVSADGYIILTKQSRKNATSHDLLAPSGSGSMDWADLNKGGSDLAALVKGAMLREMTEELGFRGRDVPESSDVRLLRYARVTHWGGKPQFYGVARIRNTDISVRGIEKRYLHGYVLKSFDTEQGSAKLIDAIGQLLADDKRRLSFPLAYNLAAVRDWLEADRLAWQWLGFA